MTRRAELAATGAALGLLIAPIGEAAGAPPSRPAAMTRRSPAPPAGTDRRPGVALARRDLPPVLPDPEEVLAPDPPLPAERSAPPAEPAGRIPVNARLGRMLAPETDAFRLPDPRSAWVARLPRNQYVAIVSQWQGWFAILMADGSQAYVPQTHVEVLPYVVRSVVKLRPIAPPTPAPQPDASGSALARTVIQEALRYRDVPYVYGGNSERGIDCSGLVQRCFAAAGVSLPRRASEQARVGRSVPFDRLQPGDRLYFSVKSPNDHTGIYLGDGYFIHAARSRGKVTIDHLSTPLYGDNLTDVRRLD